MTRLHQLDVLRGIAVLGLFIMNIPYFGVFEWGYVASDAPHWADKGLTLFNSTIVDGRFRTLFCFLFGCAIAIQYKKYSSVSKINDRNRALIVIGAAHGLFIWAGDILLAYGCAGLLLVNYLDKSAEQNLRSGFALLLVMSLILFLLTFIDPTITPTRQSSEFLEAYYRTFHDPIALFTDNAKNFLIMLVILPFLTLWYTLSLMRLGLGAWQKGWFNKGLPDSVFGVALILAFMFSALVAMFRLSNDVRLVSISEAINWLAAFFSAAVIVHIVARAMRTKSLLSRFFANAGRMSLTIYLSQSIVAVVFFRLLFPEWILTFNLLDYALFSTCILGIQLILANVYFRFYTQGPCEFLLSSWLRRKPSSSSQQFSK
ncbi:hypothetical protein PALB_17820 [Pseudoalteromonas luteoviolacea B = ATCC 29581]|nr:hypothetical protein PALB_17820 [Pseudoalteromonas luteoviolacea B = ATCC 29581]